MDNNYKNFSKFIDLLKIDKVFEWSLNLIINFLINFEGGVCGGLVVLEDIS